MGGVRSGYGERSSPPKSQNLKLFIMAKKKTKMQQIKEEIFQELQSRYHVSGKELASGSFIYADANVTVEEVLPDFEREYSVELGKKEFNNWNEFAESLARKIVRKRKF